jgi:hypothetical protein
MPFNSLYKKLCELAFYDAISSAYYRKVPRVEAGYNTSSVALRLVEDDEKRTLCLGV